MPLTNQDHHASGSFGQVWTDQQKVQRTVA